MQLFLITISVNLLKYFSPFKVHIPEKPLIKSGASSRSKIFLTPASREQEKEKIKQIGIEK